MVNVTNTGAVAGDEVVFAYFTPPRGGLGGGELPIMKQLYGFKRVHVPPGVSVTVTFGVSAEALRRVTAAGAVVAAPGAYALEFTNGVAGRVSARVEVVGAVRVLA